MSKMHASPPKSSRAATSFPLHFSGTEPFSRNQAELKFDPHRSPSAIGCNRASLTASKETDVALRRYYAFIQTSSGKIPPRSLSIQRHILRS